MAKEPLADFFDALMGKLIENNTFVNNPENIVVGESFRGIAHLNPDKFPRLELLITKLKLDGYLDQRNMSQSFRFKILGHLKREQDNTIPQDMWDAVRWGRELLQILYTFNDDRIAGNYPCEGFMQVDGFAEVDFEFELFPKTTSVLVSAEVDIQLSDIYTNN